MDDLTVSDLNLFLLLVEEGFHQYSDYEVTVKTIPPELSKFGRRFRITITHHKKNKGFLWWLQSLIKGRVKKVEFDASPERISQAITEGVDSPSLQEFVGNVVNKIEKKERLFFS